MATLQINASRPFTRPGGALDPFDARQLDRMIADPIATLGHAMNYCNGLWYNLEHGSPTDYKDRVWSKSANAIQEVYEQLCQQKYNQKKEIA